MCMGKAIFLDKDGTLIRDVPYNVDPALIQLYPDVTEALRKLKSAGYQLIVISNQAGVALGYFEEGAMTGVQHKLNELLGEAGMQLDGFYYCPHHPAGTVAAYTVDCDCRKPKLGLLVRAAREKGIDLAQSWMVGDILNDVEAGNRAGCRTVLIDNGNETEWERSQVRNPTYIVKTMAEAADRIIAAAQVPLKQIANVTADHRHESLT